MQRDMVARCFNRFEQWRALATRYAERAGLHRATSVLIAAVM